MLVVSPKLEKVNLNNLFTLYFGLDRTSLADLVLPFFALTSNTVIDELILETKSISKPLLFEK